MLPTVPPSPLRFIFHLVDTRKHRPPHQTYPLEREDGKKQTTFRGYPLYYWAGDKAPGDTKGQGVNNVWYVIDPAKFPLKM